MLSSSSRSPTNHRGERLRTNIDINTLFIAEDSHYSYPLSIEQINIKRYYKDTNTAKGQSMMADDNTNSSSTLGKRRRIDNNNTNNSININTSHQINNKQTYKQIPSEIFATNILNYLDYQSILSLSVTCKHILHNIIPLITTLHINKSIQMNGLIVQRRRFRDNVKSINIYSLLVQRSEEDFDQNENGTIKYYNVDSDTVMRFIPFISQFSNLQRVFVGGMVRGQVIHIPNRSNLWDDEGDVNRVQTLMDMISGAFRVGGVLPRDLQVMGLRCPHSRIRYTRDNEEVILPTCQVCERACQSLPLEQVVQFGNGGMLSDDINNNSNFHLPRCGLNHVCLDRSQIESIVESRTGGNALLRSNARFMYLLGRGSLYEIQMEDPHNITERTTSENRTVNNEDTEDGNSSSDESMPGPDEEESDEGSSSDEDMANEGDNEAFETPHGTSLYIVMYTVKEMEELQRVLEYAGLNAARIPQEEVTRAIMQSFARDDKAPPSNQCYLSKRSLIDLRDTLGLSIDDEAFSTPDVKVGHSIQLAQAVADDSPIHIECIPLLCNVLEKVKHNTRHQAVVRMITSNVVPDLVGLMGEGYPLQTKQDAIRLVGGIVWNSTRANKEIVVDAAIRALVRSLGSKNLNIAHEAARTIGKIAMDSDCRNEILEANAIYPMLMLMKRSRDIDVIGEVVWTLQNITKGFGRPGSGFNHLKICLEPLSQILLADKHKLKGDQSKWTSVQRYICSILYWICRYQSPNSQSRDALYTVMKTGIIPHLMNINIKEGASFLRLLVNHDKLWSLYHRRDLLPGLIPFLTSLNEMNRTIAFRSVCNSLSYAEKDYIPAIVTRLGRQLPTVILLLHNRKDAWLTSDKSANYSKTLVCGGCISPLCNMISNGKDGGSVDEALKALQLVSIHVIQILTAEGKQSYTIAQSEVDQIIESLMPFLDSSDMLTKAIASQIICNSMLYAEKDHIPSIIDQLGYQLPYLILELSTYNDGWLTVDNVPPIMKMLVCGGCIRPLCDIISNSKDETIVVKALQALQVVSNIDMTAVMTLLYKILTH